MGSTQAQAAAEGAEVSESDVVKSCKAYLALIGALAWRNQTAFLRIEDPKYGTRVMRQGVRGGADIIGVLPGGRFIAVECKTPPIPGPRGGRRGGKQTEDQRAFELEVTRRGGMYVLAHGVEDLKRAIPPGVKL